MGGNYVGNAATFLVDTVFGLYILIVLLRLLLQWVQADFYNPLSQFIVRATQPVLRPLRRVVPGYAGIDLASVALLVGLQFVALWLSSAFLGYSARPAGLLVLTVAELLSLTTKVFLFSILIEVVLSWVNPGARNPIIAVLHSLNRPLLGPARRLLPPMGGLDLSPLVVLVVLQLVTILLVAPMRDAAKALL